MIHLSYCVTNPFEDMRNTVPMIVSLIQDLNLINFIIFLDWFSRKLKTWLHIRFPTFYDSNFLAQILNFILSFTISYFLLFPLLNLMMYFFTCALYKWATLLFNIYLQKSLISSIPLNLSLMEKNCSEHQSTPNGILKKKKSTSERIQNQGAQNAISDTTTVAPQEAEVNGFREILVGDELPDVPTIPWSRIAQSQKVRSEAFDVSETIEESEVTTEIDHTTDVTETIIPVRTSRRKTKQIPFHKKKRRKHSSGI